MYAQASVAKEVCPNVSDNYQIPSNEDLTFYSMEMETLVQIWLCWKPPEHWEPKKPVGSPSVQVTHVQHDMIQTPSLTIPDPLLHQVILQKEQQLMFHTCLSMCLLSKSLTPDIQCV